MSELLILIVLVCIYGAVILLKRYRDKKIMDAAPPITRAEVDAVRQYIEENKLPLVNLKLSKTQPAGPVDTKIGGRPWHPGTDEDWPLSKSGEPLSFLAQINFAQLPTIDDFPKQGLLQLFYKDFGAPGDDDQTGGFAKVVRWYADPKGDQQFELPDNLPRPRKDSWLATDQVQKKGIGAEFEWKVLPPTTFTYPLDEMAGFIGARRHPENEEVRKMIGEFELTLEAMDDEFLEEYGTHWVGGHPYFIQGDVRSDPAQQHLDRVILHLGSGDNLMIGDAGTANLMINQDDLRNQRFDRAFFWMDCH